MKHYLLLLVLATAPVLIQGQEVFVVEGQVKDVTTNDPIPGVYVSGLSSDKVTITSSDGSFRLKGSKNELEVLSLSHVSYVLEEVKPDFSKGTKIHLEVRMIFQSFQVPEATVEEQKPDTVFGSKERHVVDFAFTNSGKMLLLTYTDQKHIKRQDEVDVDLYDGCKLLLIDEEGEESSSLNLEFVTKSLIKDYRGRIYLESRHGLHRIYFDKAQMSLKEFNSKDFYEYINPIIDSTGSFLYFSNYDPTFPEFDYFAVNVEDSSFSNLRRVTDDFQLQVFRASYRDLKERHKLAAFRKELETGIDKEIIAGYMSGYPSSMYYEELYSPLFVVKDTVLIFDYCKGRLIRMDQNNQVLDSLAIQHHIKNGGQEWTKKLLKDDQKENILAVHEKNGYMYLKKLNLADSSVEYSFKLTHRYPENLKVFNDKVFYTYRPFGSIQKKFLYSEALPVTD